MSDNKNIIIAVLLSIGILGGYHYLFEVPRLERLKAIHEHEQALKANTLPAQNTAAIGDHPVGASIQQGDLPTAVLGTPNDGTAPSTFLERQTALDQVPRVLIRSERVAGSISLQGGRIDDVTLRQFKEEMTDDSPAVTLLSPLGTQRPYYADFGWVAPGANIKLPTPQTYWVADDQVLEDNDTVTLKWDNGEGLLFKQTYHLDRDFMFKITQEVVNNSDNTVRLHPYGLISRTEKPDVSDFFILHEGMLGVFNNTLEEVDYDDLQKERTRSYDSEGGWLGITDKYWLTALVPPQAEKVKSSFSYGTRGAQDKFQADYLGQVLSVSPGQTVESKSYLFAGAKEVGLIDRYKEDLGIKRFDLAIDFGWFYFLTKPLFHLIEFINGYINNFGLAIIILTVLIRLFMFPLASKSFTAMSKMRKLNPQIQKLRERLKDDKVKMQQELMALYKKEKVNPMAGCLPILIQIPIFFALYKVLFINIEMRHAPFYGWIQDLSAPDPTSIFNLFGLLPIEPIFHLGAWPLIMGLTMFLQQKLNPKPADPIQAKMMMAMPIVFTALLANFPAGLVIYWAWGNILSLAQQWVISRRVERGA